MKFVKLASAAVAMSAAMISLAAPALATTVFTLPTVSGNQSFTGELGLDFTVNHTVLVDSLGAFTNGDSSIAVTLYNLSTNLSVASTTITSGPISGVYSFQALGTPVLLAPGTYQIAASGYNALNPDYNPDQPGGTIQASFNTLNGALTQGGAFYSFTPGQVATTFDAFTTTYGAGNFTAAVPELSTWTMLLLGFTGIGFFVRRRTSSRHFA